jgi:hypothetical protein
VSEQLKVRKKATKDRDDVEGNVRIQGDHTGDACDRRP